MLRKLAICLLLTGCGQTITTVPLERPKLEIEQPKPLKMGKVKFVVVTKENAEAVFKTMEKTGDQPVVFGLSGTDYKNLAVNTEAIKNHIILLNKILEAYKAYYESAPK